MNSQECKIYRVSHSLPNPAFFFNNSNNHEDIVMKFEQEYVRCVRNKEECVCSACLFRCNIFIGVRIIKEIPGGEGFGSEWDTLYLYFCTGVYGSEVANKRHMLLITFHTLVLSIVNRIHWLRLTQISACRNYKFVD
jgi:hypothetical protein